MQDTGARARYDTLSRPHQVPAASSPSSRLRSASRSATPQSTPCQDVDLDDMRALPDGGAAGACSASGGPGVVRCSSHTCAVATAGYRFEYPCRCGDRFVVAESARGAEASVLLLHRAKTLTRPRLRFAQDLAADARSVVVPCGCARLRVHAHAARMRCASDAALQLLLVQHLGVVHDGRATGH